MAKSYGSELTDLLTRTDASLKDLEDGTIATINKSLKASYLQLEEKLQSKWSGYTADAQPNLLATQRALLLADQLKDQLILLNPQVEKAMTARFDRLLTTANQQGENLAGQLLSLSSGEQDAKWASANIPIEAVASQAKNASTTLAKHSQEFAEKASVVVQQGMIQGWGAAKTAKAMAEQLGILLYQAERIVRTESMNAYDNATRSRYKANEVNYVMRVATGDAKVCGSCAARAGQIYEIDKAPAVIHPNDRCTNVPVKKEWVDAGLVDLEWAKGHAKDTQARTQEKLTQKGTNFEKGKPPTPLWNPEKGFINGGLKPSVASQVVVSTVAEIATPPAIGFTQELVSSSLQKGKRNLHKTLMKEGRRIANRFISGEEITLEDIKRLRQHLLSSGARQDFSRILAQQVNITPEAALKALTPLDEILVEFNQITHGKLRQGRGENSFKGFIYDGNSRAAANGELGLIRVGDQPEAHNMYHELGHILEDQNPRLAQAARDWRDSKATGPAVPLNDLTGTNIYDDDELALPGNYVSKYVAKVYNDGSTEVLSVGFEYFASDEALLRLAQKDPEHFHFMLGVIEDLKTSTPTVAKNIKKGTRLSGMPGIDDVGYRPLTPVEAAMMRDKQQRSKDFAAYLDREKESIRRRVSGEIDRELREYYSQEAANLRQKLGIRSPKNATPAVEVSDIPGLTLSMKSPTPTPVRLPKKLGSIDKSTLNKRQLEAFNVAAEYEEILQELNEAISKIPGGDKTLPTEAYQRIYEKTDQLMARLTASVNNAKKLAGGNLENDVLDQYMRGISSISKESLPGYFIQRVDASIVNKAAVRPC